MVKNDALRQMIEDFNKSKTVKALDRYFREKSTMEILGVDRDENAHSNFLAWLFENTHIRNFSIQHLVEIIIQKHHNPNNESILKDFFSKEITNISVNREERIVLHEKDNYGRVDIVVRVECKTGERFCFIIENKVFSKEHSIGKKASKMQTIAYKEHYSKEFVGYTPIYLYLTVKGDKATCQDFIPITYQELADNVILPLADYQCLHTDLFTQIKIRDYIKALSLSYSQDNFMAIDPYLKDKALEIWNEFQTYFSTQARNKNEDFKDTLFIKHLFYVLRHLLGDEVKAVDDFVNGKDYTKYAINGEGYYSKNGVIFEVACRLFDTGITDIVQLRKIIPSNDAFISKEDYMTRKTESKDKVFERKWKQLNDNIFVHQSGWDEKETFRTVISRINSIPKLKDVVISEIPFSV